MTYRSASRIADYLTGGYFADAGYSASAFPIHSGDRLKVFLDFSGGADLRVVRIALNAWSTVTGLEFGLRGTASSHDLRLTDANSGAYSYSQSTWSGERLSAVVNVGRDWLNAYGTKTVSYYTQTWIHEIGHALGLGHAGPYNGSASWGDHAFALDSWQMSVMSYFSPSENPNVTASYGFVLTPMPADILAIHRLYGAPSDINGGNETYGFDGTATGVYKLFGDMLDSGRLDLPALITIYDPNGRDRLNMSNDTHDQRIDLAPGAFSDVLGHVGTLGIAYDTLIEEANGGAGDDLITGNRTANRLTGGAGGDKLHGRTGNDTLLGGSGHDRVLGGHGNDALLGQSGNDRIGGGRGADRLFGNGGDDLLIGGPGADLLNGGAGADRFLFRPQDNAAIDIIDQIVDFASGEDLLDLRSYDLDQIRFGAGRLAEGLLRIIDGGGDLHVRADLDGDGRTDLRIVLLNCDGLTRDDILL